MAAVDADFCCRFSSAAASRPVAIGDDQRADQRQHRGDDQREDDLAGEHGSEVVAVRPAADAVSLLEPSRICSRMRCTALSQTGHSSPKAVFQPAAAGRLTGPWHDPTASGRRRAPGRHNFVNWRYRAGVACLVAAGRSAPGRRDWRRPEIRVVGVAAGDLTLQGRRVRCNSGTVWASTARAVRRNRAAATRLVKA